MIITCYNRNTSNTDRKVALLKDRECNKSQCRTTIFSAWWDRPIKWGCVLNNLLPSGNPIFTNPPKLIRNWRSLLKRIALYWIKINNSTILFFSIFFNRTFTIKNKAAVNNSRYFFSNSLLNFWIEFSKTAYLKKVQK